ncbi:MAG: hypothetical protein M0O94_00610 [Bacteroidales bacterium]|jgi:hypothetical protein|nr:hypothetical protein [Bacteroidales bacterium]MDD3960412.1 hypothetical protein [Bacteroidales bacterium]MDY0285554.1 hypothetical protein [Bacteroidales bacterium]HPE86093.1 hypothetical protein [Bacteroidales bacterium]
MKKIFFVALISLMSVSLFAGTPDLFDLDETAIEQQFQELNTLEYFVLSNANVADLDLSSAGLDLSKFAFSMDVNAGFEFMWEGFLWGFLCCPVGFFVIALDNNESKDNKTSFWVGVGASVVLSAITGPIYYSSYY